MLQLSATLRYEWGGGDNTEKHYTVEREGRGGVWGVVVARGSVIAQ